MCDVARNKIGRWCTFLWGGGNNGIFECIVEYQTYITSCPSPEDDDENKSNIPAIRHSKTEAAQFATFRNKFIPQFLNVIHVRLSEFKIFVRKSIKNKRRYKIENVLTEIVFS